MKCMERNKIVFYYALYTERVPVVDEYGNDTGEFEVRHGNPVKSAANVSAARGETQMRQFGENVSYDKVIAMDSDGPPIDEYSILWIDTVPELNADGSLVVDDEGNTKTPHDYIVKKVAKSLNSVSFAVSKVSVT